jgi:hypothetical protein
MLRNGKYYFDLIDIYYGKSRYTSVIQYILAQGLKNRATLYNQYNIIRKIDGLLSKIVIDEKIKYNFQRDISAVLITDTRAKEL